MTMASLVLDGVEVGPSAGRAARSLLPAEGRFP